jgi:hypothetical protein
MQSEATQRFHWTILICAFAGAAWSVLVAILLLAGVVAGHTSRAVEILLVGLGVLSFFIGLFFLAFGALYRQSFALKS